MNSIRTHSIYCFEHVSTYSGQVRIATPHTDDTHDTDESGDRVLSQGLWSYETGLASTSPELHLDLPLSVALETHHVIEESTFTFRVFVYQTQSRDYSSNV